MNFTAFLDSLPIMGKGMAIILGVMLLVWGMIEAIRFFTKEKKQEN